MLKAKLYTILALIVFAALLRLLPHLPNFTPIVAIALFGGGQIRNRYLSLIVVFGAMLISDAFLGFHPVMWATYLSLGMIVFVGRYIDGRAQSIVVASIASSILFFIVTNFGVWMSGWIYQLTMSGLAECYIAAIPFFGYSVVGDLFYCAVLFSLYQLAESRINACYQA